MPRFFVDLPLARELEPALPAAAARHVQVLRLQPGDAITLFDGRGGREGRLELAGQGQVDEEARHGSRTGRSRPVCLRLCAESAVRRWTA